MARKNSQEVDDIGIKSLTISHEEKKSTSLTDNQEIFEEMLHVACTGSIDLDDDQIDVMTDSYSEIFGKPTDGSLRLRTGKKSDPKVVEETGITVGFSDEVEGTTPVYEGVDPTQAFMAEDRINAFLQENSFQQAIEEQKESDAVGVSGDNGSLPGGSPLKNQRLPLSLSTLPSPVPPIDPSAILDLEAHARGIATSMDTLTENLTGTLQSISALTVDCVEAYRDAVCKTCDAVDSNVKSMYQLMAKTEELNKSMKPIYHLEDQIKEIRRILDMFENVRHYGSS